MARGGASRHGGRSARLFVSLDVPRNATAVIHAAIAPWREVFPVARWVAPSSWHVTVRFLGPVRAEQLARIGVAVGEAAATKAPFGTRLRELGAFPSPCRARVVWVGLDDGEGRMAALALALDAALSAELRPETRAFRPHLTVARCDPPLSLPGSFLSTSLEPVGFEVDRVVLFESVPSGPSPRYEALEVFPLTG